MEMPRTRAQARREADVSGDPDASDDADASGDAGAELADEIVFGFVSPWIANDLRQELHE